VLVLVGMGLDPDPMLVGRYAALVAACDLIPLPLLDLWVENRVRRALVRAQAQRCDVVLDEPTVALLADRNSGGCWGFFMAVLWWPIKKVLKALTTVFMVKGAADVASEVVHRALLVDDALRMGELPARAREVRLAMDRAMDHIDTRWVERWLLGRYRRPNGAHNRQVHEQSQTALDAGCIVSPAPALASHARTSATVAASCS